jgi:ribosomal protein L21E
MIMINETNILVNNEVKVTAPRSQWHGKHALVRRVMADGRTLEVEIANESGKIVFIDVGLVSEIQEPSTQVQQPQSLGPIANSVVQDGI